MKKLLPLLLLFSACTCKVVKPPPVFAPAATEIVVRDAVVPSKPLRGLDLLGLPLQDVKMIAETIEPGTMIGIFADQTFGPGALEALEVLLKTGKVPAFRTHLFWTSHLTPKDSTNQIKIAAAKVEAFHQHYPATTCYVSPICEYGEKNASLVRGWAEAAQKAAPSCKVVMTPEGGAAVLPDYPVEKHGTTVKGFAVSTDGGIVWDANTAALQNAASEYVLAWWLRCNLSTSGTLINPPSKRTAQIPKDDIIEAQILLDNAPSPKPTGKPPGCKTMRELQGKELYKPNGEDLPKDLRSNKPCLISHITSQRVSIINAAGKEVGCMKYFDTYDPYGPGYFRHYAGSCDGQSSVDWHTKAGDWVYVRDGNSCILIPTVRRSGDFR